MQRILFTEHPLLTTYKPYVYNIHLFSSQQIRKQILLLTIPFSHIRKLSLRKLSNFLKVTQGAHIVRQKFNQGFSNCQQDALLFITSLCDW